MDLSHLTNNGSGMFQNILQVNAKKTPKKKTLLTTKNMKFI